MHYFPLEIKTNVCQFYKEIIYYKTQNFYKNVKILNKYKKVLNKDLNIFKTQF